MSDKENVQMSISDYNLQTISTSDYSSLLEGSIQSGSNLAVFGRRGSGKTDIARQIIALTKMLDGPYAGQKAREVYVNLSVAERTDMGGYPDMFGTMEKLSESEKREKFIKYILPMFYEPMIVGNQPIVVIFDEVDKADPSIWGPLLEILQDKAINHRPLKNLQSSILTGNLISEGSQRPSLPLLDRTEKYLLKADTSSFLSWAAKSNKIHPSIRAFLTDKADKLYGTNDGMGDLYAEPSPRGWEYASRALFFGEKHGWSKELINKKVAGFVGKQSGIEYEIYFEHYRELLPLIDAIFNGDDMVSTYKNKNPSMQIYAAMIVCSRLAGILDRVPFKDGSPIEIPKELGSIGRFMQKAVSDENILIAVRTQLTLNRMVSWNLDSNKDWGKSLINVVNNLDKS